jgi:hypothetical protein
MAELALKQGTLGRYSILERSASDIREKVVYMGQRLKLRTELKLNV